MLKPLLTTSSHRLLQLFCRASDNRFQHQRNQLEKVQRQRFASICASSNLCRARQVKSYEAFREAFAVTRYADWRPAIQALREQGTALSSSPMVRFQPTSGSSEQIKLIPYNKAFLDELDQAIAPWLASMYRKCPSLAKGQHYWSVSWLPESQRDLLKSDNLNDDSVLLSLSKRILSQFTQVVPSNVSFAARAEDALFATLCYLVASENLAMISVWSPTFALQLFENLNNHAQEISQVLRHADWGSRQDSLQALTAPHAPQRAALLEYLAHEAGTIDLRLLWPQLALMSSWDTAGSVEWAKQLKQSVPHVQFEGKGLWATEGVVTIPYNGLYPLSYQSHFYEFEHLSGSQAGQVVPSWQLREGDHVSPILSCGNGMLRYSMDDHLLVNGFFGQVPCFTFQGRRFGVDLVGEKLSPEIATKILATFQQDQLQPISLFAVDTQQNNKPFYCALYEGNPQFLPTPGDIDRELRRNFHYELARDLGQLAEPQTRCVPNGWETYKKLVMSDHMIEGNIKPEPLKRVSLRSWLEHV
jgi:hypothetical protein